MENRDKLVRISMSLPEKLLEQFDSMIEERALKNRSQAIIDLLHRELVQHQKNVGEDVMAGTINLVYDHSAPGLQQQLAELQYSYIDEVISCLNVNLTQPYTLSVYLVQGPAATLKKIIDAMKAHRGVKTGELILSSSILPPLHPLSD